MATPQKSMPSTWSNTNVDINLDALSPTGRQNKMTSPSMNQLQQVTPSRAPAAGNMGQGMMGSGIPQGMMGVPAGMMGGQGMQQGMMGTQTGMMGSQGMMGSGAGIAGLNQGMAGMSLQSPTGSMNMMGPRPMMSQQMGYGMGMQPGMMGPMNMGAMGMQGPNARQSSFQQRTDQAFSAFGSMKQ